MSSASAPLERTLPAIKVPDNIEVSAAAGSSPVFCRTTRRCLSRKSSSSPASQQAAGPHPLGTSSLSASRRGSVTPCSAASSGNIGTSFGCERSLSAIPKPQTDLSQSVPSLSGVIPAPSVLDQSSCGSVTVNGIDSLPCSGCCGAGPSGGGEGGVRDCSADGVNEMEGYQAVSCSENLSSSEGSRRSDKEAFDPISVVFGASSFSQHLCNRVQHAVLGRKRRSNNSSEADLRLELAKVLSDGCAELAHVASELCSAAGGAHEDVCMFTPEQIQAWRASRGHTRSSSVSYTHLTLPTKA